MYLLLGYGIANQAVAKFLQKNNLPYIVYDDNVAEYTQLIQLNNINMIIKSPGISNEHFLIEQAKILKIPIVTDLEFFYSFYPHKKYITITGSNGKTTTVTLTHEILKNANKKYFLGGNIGIPIFNYSNDDSDLLIEASSFMLEYIKDYHSYIACILNLTTAHLDHHKTFANYRKAKQNLFKNQTAQDFVVYNLDDKIVAKIAKKSKAIKVPFSKTKITNGAYLIGKHLYFQNQYIISLDEIKLLGMHNIENILASIAICKILNIDNEIIRNTIKSFQGIEHRIEYVCQFKNSKVYNDSKSTNLFALRHALEAFPSERVLLICGGKYREDNFSFLDDAIGNVNKVLIFGENRNVFLEYFQNKKINAVTFHNLEEVVKYLYENEVYEEIILFSPGSSSQDQFKNYEERGRKFKSYMI